MTSCSTIALRVCSRILGALLVAPVGAAAGAACGVLAVFNNYKPEIAVAGGMWGGALLGAVGGAIWGAKLGERCCNCCSFFSAERQPLVTQAHQVGAEL